ncbi:hypothetical protein BpHYR1_027198 [Brachionus plicatilis]|uniref:Uncharacterized protein n=1 Tax=Brachionus plicatilis TaxID=10195 RepID=A0A3M7P834_BRAPC|nr:hypothetical protein BpHYR1_027198 [Brachionus plicatilis]
MKFTFLKVSISLSTKHIEVDFSSCSRFFIFNDSKVEIGINESNLSFKSKQSSGIFKFDCRKKKYLLMKIILIFWPISLYNQEKK